jgi:hypothetical protein
LNFDGMGSITSPGIITGTPPDTNGVVGSTQYVQIVNGGIEVFDKATGAVVQAARSTNTLWTGFAGACSTHNDGDGVVVYDKLANRWVISQFALNIPSGPYFQCVAVSKTSDATGMYNLYDFQYSNLNDYPKMGVWPDGYYTTFNMFDGSTFAFLGVNACAMDRAKMLAGQPASQICFQLDVNSDPLLPSDVDGPTPPPAGAPNYMLGFNSTTQNSLNLYKFHVDFTTPANSTFMGPTSLPVAAFTIPCASSPTLTCIPQKGTSNQLDSLGDRVMFRLG